MSFKYLLAFNGNSMMKLLLKASLCYNWLKLSMCLYTTASKAKKYETALVYKIIGLLFNLFIKPAIR